MHYVEDFGMTEDRKKEYLRTLWWIMAAFVNLGFGVDSVTRLFAREGALERKQIARQTIQKMKARLEQGYFVFRTPVG
jgi:hypothetical protein